MSRNASGTYTLVAGNPVVTGTVVASAWANDTLTDVATEMTDSLSRTGKGGMTSPLKVPNGTVAAPAYTFSNFLTSGAYMAGTADYRVSVGGIDRLKLTASGAEVVGDIVVSGTVDGRDVAADGATADAALPKAGGTMTGIIAGFESTGIDDNATSTAVTIDSAGIVTKPNQPSFLVYPSVDTTGADLTYEKLEADTVLHNVGNHYDTSTYLFTAPVVGSYQFNTNVRFNSVGGNYSVLRFYKNGSSISGVYVISQQTGSYFTLNASAVINLEANDTVEVRAYVNGDSTWTIDNLSSFSGYLLG
jgi:hypothetical protein